MPAPPESTGTAGRSSVYRLREGIERFFITDINSPAAAAQAQSTLPVMWDAIGSSEFGDNAAGSATFNHIPGGCNVLHMDGHAGLGIGHVPLQVMPTGQTKNQGAQPDALDYAVDTDPPG